tara:strand:+ start:3922 stop:4107 length:186 start_codon:yes stop_codon:yes gene_type:complete
LWLTYIFIQLDYPEFTTDETYSMFDIIIDVFFIYSCEQIIEPVNIKNKSIKLHGNVANSEI